MSWQEDLAERVVGHLAEEPHPAPERGHPHRGVGRRAARHLDGRPHAPYRRRRPGQVDQLHAPFDQVETGQVLVGGVGEDVDQGGADGHDIERPRDVRRYRRGVVHSSASYSHDAVTRRTSAPSGPG